MFTFRPREVASHWRVVDSKMWNWELGPITIAIANIFQNQSFVMLTVSCSCVPHDTNLYTLPIISLIVRFPSTYFPSLWPKDRETPLLVQHWEKKTSLWLISFTWPAGSTTPLSIQSWHRLEAGQSSEKVGLATGCQRINMKREGCLLLCVTSSFRSKPSFHSIAPCTF